jgi:hypothetical protein
MKNIHLLPTDKPSRLYKSKITQNIFISNIISQYGDATYNQHIYITSDEEIKYGDWYLDTFNTQRIKANEFSDHKHYGNACKKIILTTDQDLITDGVQAIDDEFLEWFVKNPTVEYVTVERLEDGKFVDYLSTGEAVEGVYENYKIIIPQEEPKQETLNKINNMNEEIKKQINLLEEEQTRVKQFINENNFNCTTAPWVIAKQYRDEIKKHIGILKMNLEN